MLSPRPRRRRYNPDGWSAPGVWVIFTIMTAVNLAAVLTLPDLPAWLGAVFGFLLGVSVNQYVHARLWKSHLRRLREVGEVDEI